MSGGAACGTGTCRRFVFLIRSRMKSNLATCTRQLSTSISGSRTGRAVHWSCTAPAAARCCCQSGWRWSAGTGRSRRCWRRCGARNAAKSRCRCIWWRATTGRSTMVRRRIGRSSWCRGLGRIAAGNWHYQGQQRCATAPAGAAYRPQQTPSHCTPDTTAAEE